MTWLLHQTSAIHQRGCIPKRCGGEFTCRGCERVCGWCFGCNDLLGPEHCDDCYTIRRDVLRNVKYGRVWAIDPVVFNGLRVEGFVEKRSGQFSILTDKGREALK